MRKISVVLLSFILCHSVYAFSFFHAKKNHKRTSYGSALLQKKHSAINDEDFFGQWQGICTNDNGGTETDGINIEWVDTDEIKINGMFFINHESTHFISSGKQESDSGHIKFSWDASYNKLEINEVGSSNEYNNKALEYFVNSEVAHSEKGRLSVEKEFTVYNNGVRQDTPMKSHCIYQRIYI